MKRLIDDELWALVQPLLPPHAPHPKGGRPFVDDRAALTGIVFVLRSGIPWEMLPHELGCGSGVTCWRRLRDWQAAGVWDRLHQLLLGRLAQAGKLDWRRACLDSRSLAAKRGAGHEPESDRPSAPWQQAPCTGRCQRDPIGHTRECGQPQRLQTARANARRRGAGTHAPTGAAPSQARQAARRQRLRPCLLPQGMPPSWRCAAHRASRQGGLTKTGTPPLGRRTHPGLAGALSLSDHPLRAPGGHPPRFSLPGLHPHLPAMSAAVMKDALRGALIRRAERVAAGLRRRSGTRWPWRSVAPGGSRGASRRNRSWTWS